MHSPGCPMCRSIHWPEAFGRWSPGGHSGWDPVAGRERADLLAAADRAARRAADRWVLVLKKSDADLANEALQQGIAAQNAGRLAEAAADYREVLVHDPNNKYAYFDLGTHRPDERSAGLG